MRVVVFAVFSVLAASLGLAQTPASSAKGKVALYSAVGAELTEYVSWFIPSGFPQPVLAIIGLITWQYLRLEPLARRVSTGLC